MASVVSSPPQYITELQRSLQYDFNNMGHLVEALRAPGAGYLGPTLQRGNEGYRRLAQLGECLLRVAIIDESYVRGLDRGRGHHYRSCLILH